MASCASVPSAAHTSAISLAKHTLSAWKVFDTYFTISAVLTAVCTKGASTSAYSDRSTAAGAARGPDTDQPDLRIPQSLGSRDRRAQPSRVDDIGQQRGEPGLDDRRCAGIDHGDLLFIDVDADHLVSSLRQTGRGHASHVAEPEHVNAHDAQPPRTCLRTPAPPPTTNTPPPPGDVPRFPAPGTGRDPGGARRPRPRTPRDRPPEGSAFPRRAEDLPPPRSSIPRPSPSRAPRRS